MQMTILLLAAMTLNGYEHPAGSAITVPHSSGLTAIKEGLATGVETIADPADALKTPEGTNEAGKVDLGGTPPQTSENADLSPDNAGGRQSNTEQSPTDAAVEVERMRKALDAQYKADELKAAAKAANVEFAYDDNKAVVIQKVIDQDKAEILLK